MPDARTIELIHERIDGVIDDAGRAELEAVLARDPETRKIADELGALNELLAGVPDEEPPATLAGDVMAAVRNQRIQAPASFAAGSASRRRVIFARVGIGIAAALAAIFAFVPSLRDSIDPGDSAGTMIERAGELRPAREIPIRAERISGTIRVTPQEDRVSVLLEFDVAATRQLRVSFDPARVAPEISAPAGGEPGPDSATRNFTIDAAGRSTELRFVRSGPGPANIALDIVQGADTYETTIDLWQ
jgi:hypothetical protein